ncbi:MAG: hypothetical protein CM1200mP14_26640 [Gammaproteobacteria bacterium]|nr:MAG: hypothetical protein CM1200mP14_26640 [Gammaproteobacteria bacterium]
MITNVLNTGSWQNYGVDFTGGSLIQIQVYENLNARIFVSAQWVR